MSQPANVNKQDLEQIASAASLNAPQAVRDAVQQLSSGWSTIVQMDQQILKQRAMEAARELSEQLPCEQTRDVRDAVEAWLLPTGE